MGFSISIPVMAADGNYDGLLSVPISFIAAAFLATFGLFLTWPTRALVARLAPGWSWKTSALLLASSLALLAAVVAEFHSRLPGDAGPIWVQWLRVGALLFGIFESQFAAAWWPPVDYTNAQPVPKLKPGSP